MREVQASKVAEEFLKGLDYPIRRADILRAAHEASLGPTLEDALKALPDREYQDPEDVTGSLNAS
jgi:hypothetical protein